MKKFMLAASAFAILAVSPAMAQNAEVQTQTEVEAKTGWENTKEATADAWESTKKAVSEAADATAAKTEEIYEDTAAWLDSKTDVDAYVDNQTRFSVTDLSGMDVYNSQNVKIGEVSDLIIEDDGDIEKLVPPMTGCVAGAISFSSSNTTSAIPVPNTAALIKHSATLFLTLFLEKSSSR